MRLRLWALSALVSIAGAGDAPAGDTIRIAIDKLTFAPKDFSAHVGDKVEWVNGDFVPHTATARNKDWDVAIPAKGTGVLTLTRAGDVEYFCRFHPNMVGHISVAPQ
jgi:plastocyanin